MTKELPPLESIADFLLNAPLYTEYKLADDLEVLSHLTSKTAAAAGRWNKKLDGYCPQCRRETTYTYSGFNIPSGQPWDDVKKRYCFEEVTLTCGRIDWHLIRFYVRLRQMALMKVGQYPSVADIAIEEARTKYSTILKGDNWRELYKAIGLAAHGEGIGSFVYLRRVLERLVQSRFDEFKVSEGWREEDFVGLRMDEKVKFLAGHLPNYLVESRRIYSIFSKGVHELNDEQCLAFFEIGKRSILIVLEDDLKKKQELEDRRALQSAIAQFSPQQGDEG